ncbi:MAG: DUF1272 domain-containing protein [Microcoleus sp. SIO2G3]|nr:DUF1272 domain-containing protein [Microcoleus sp. SIO2G3]
MLELRPNCECCDRDLPPNSLEAMICSFECTFCRNCVEQKLNHTCPNCGGEFLRRPVRPVTGTYSLATFPASTKRVYKPEGCAAAV